MYEIKFLKYKDGEVWGLKCSFMYDGMHYFNVRKNTLQEVKDFIDQHSNKYIQE